VKTRQPTGFACNDFQAISHEPARLTQYNTASPRSGIKASNILGVPPPVSALRLDSQAFIYDSFIAAIREVAEIKPQMGNFIEA
jgi:hypothetical protein